MQIHTLADIWRSNQHKHMCWKTGEASPDSDPSRNEAAG